jgi:hypothetical protein
MSSLLVINRGCTNYRNQAMYEYLLEWQYGHVHTILQIQLNIALCQGRFQSVVRLNVEENVSLLSCFARKEMLQFYSDNDDVW